MFPSLKRLKVVPLSSVFCFYKSDLSGWKMGETSSIVSLSCRVQEDGPQLTAESRRPVTSALWPQTEAQVRGVEGHTHSSVCQSEEDPGRRRQEELGQPVEHAERPAQSGGLLLDADGLFLLPVGSWCTENRFSATPSRWGRSDSNHQ